MFDKKEKQISIIFQRIVPFPKNPSREIDPKIKLDREDDVCWLIQKQFNRWPRHYDNSREV